MAKARSPQYPGIGLEEAIRRIELVYKADAQNKIAREVVAKHAGYSGLTGPSLSMLSALKKYGLLDGSGEECYVSDLALQIIAHPKGTPERAAALQEAALRPTLFVEIENRFKGARPSDDALRSYLLTKKFLPGKVDIAARAYRETMTLVAEETRGYDVGSAARDAVPQVAEESLRDEMAALPQPVAKGARTICRYDFEPEGAVILTVSGPVSTEDALDAVEALIKMKRDELERRTTAERSEPPSQESDHSES